MVDGTRNSLTPNTPIREDTKADAIRFPLSVSSLCQFPQLRKLLSRAAEKPDAPELGSFRSFRAAGRKVTMNGIFCIVRASAGAAKRALRHSRRYVRSSARPHNLPFASLE